MNIRDAQRHARLARITSPQTMSFTMTAASLAAPASIAPSARALRATSSARLAATRARVVAPVAKTSIQFIKGLEETTQPDVRLTRSKDGTNGTAFFIFKESGIFEAPELPGDITGMFLTDEEGEISTVDVKCKFSNGKPVQIEATYVMKSTNEWNRFMRFMERYAEDNGMGFSKK